jgi:hypothetical protein
MVEPWCSASMASPTSTEEPRTLNDLVSLHINDMSYSVGDLSKLLIMNEAERQDLFDRSARTRQGAGIAPAHHPTSQDRIDAFMRNFPPEAEIMQMSPDDLGSIC